MRVLVADDERPIRRFLNASLSGQYTVLEAATGEETLAVTVSGRPDVIILDLGLPDVDGVEVTRRCGSGRRYRSSWSRYGIGKRTRLLPWMPEPMTI